MKAPPTFATSHSPLRASALDPERFAAELEGASWAVVSFAGADAAWCAWLYENLNAYPVPAELVERTTAHGFPRPDCLSLFPDPHDAHFADHYALALETSSYLIVVCSPHSAHAALVDEQIRAFKSAGGDERIVALVVESAPHARLETLEKSADPAWLPPWLAWRWKDGAFAAADRTEPRIIDARPGHARLQDVRDALLCALLETEPRVLAKLGGCARTVVPPASAKPVPAPAPTPFPIMPKVRVIPRRPRRKLPLALAACAVALAAGAAGWFAAVPEPTPAPGAHRAPPPLPHFYATEVRTPAPVAPTALVAPSSAMPASTVFEHPNAEAPSAVSRIIAPLDETTLLADAREWQQRAEEALNQHRPDEAIKMYRSALDPARLYATHPGATAEGKVEVAAIFRRLATLQSLHASTAEARASFREGRRLLIQVRSTRGQWNDERERFLGQFENGLRTLHND